MSTMRMITILLGFLLLSPVVPAQIGDAEGNDPLDIVFRWDGGARKGRIIDLTPEFLKFEVLLEKHDAIATLSIPRNNIQRVHFSERASETELLQNPAANVKKLGELWQKKLVFLAVENSNAGEFGIAYANALLDSDAREEHARALEIFSTIEESDWFDSRRALAKQGKLRAMIRLGRAEEAVEQAQLLAQDSEDPAVLMEAKYVLAEASFSRLRKLVEENPRWEEDEWVRPERDELYHRTLDFLLFPYLFFGSEAGASARSLWSAVELYRFTGEQDKAVNTAHDIVVLYPDTPEAGQASTFLESVESNPKEGEA